MALSCFRVWHASPHPSLQQAFCGMPPWTSQPFGVTCVLKNCEPHDLAFPFLIRATRVFQRLARFTTSKPPTSILWYATLDIPTFWCDMRFEELWATWPSISLSHKSDPRFVRNWESCEARFPWKSIRSQGAREKTQTENTQRENTDRKHRQKTHREKTQTENTERKHRQKTREKTQTENTDRKHTDRKRKHADRKHREKHRQKYYTILQSTTLYYSILHSTTRYDSVLQSTTQHSTSEPGIEPRWDDHIQTIVIAKTMRGAIVQIQNTNVHTPRPMRGAIPRAQNLRFATVSRDRPTESYERVHPAKSKCAFRYSGVPSKMSKCTYRYSGVHGNVWNERIASAVARGIQKSSFHHSFERPTSTKWRKGSPSQPGLAGATYKFTVKMTSTWSPCAIYTVYTTISPGLAGVTYKFTVKMKSTWSPRAIYTVYTTISPGSAGVTYKFTVKMKPTRNLYGIHNDFCGVGGGLRRGCILIRNRDWHRRGQGGV